jgi:hypothetical protein
MVGASQSTSTRCKAESLVSVSVIDDADSQLDPNRMGVTEDEFILPMDPEDLVAVDILN